MWIEYFMNDSKMVPVEHIITGIIFVFTFHMCCIYIGRSLYLESSRLLSYSHFCLPKLQQLLIYMFLLHYPGL
jgi:hypothetical protein